MPMNFRLSGRAVWIAAVIVVTLARPVAAGALAISWTDYAVDEDGFQLERRPAAGGAFQQIAIPGPNLVSYLDSTVAAGGVYCYRVRAFNSAGPSAFTAESCGTAFATAPPVTITLNAATFRPSDTMVATVHARPDSVTPVDVYVVVQGQNVLLSLQLDGRLVAGVVPIARNIVLPSIDAPFSFPLAGAPPGAYAWVAAVTAPGTMALLAPLESRPFTITP
ncbi:MAG: fibronectin type III domain-containing protein [Acidobacteriota bacterium]